MAEVQKMRGEKIYECDFNITGVTDYGCERTNRCWTSLRAGSRR
jgi:hypothetical protein